MYRLVLYHLIVLVGAAFVLAYFGYLPFSPEALAFSVLAILAISWVTNKIFAYVFKVPLNVESVWITALILVLLISPPTGDLSSSLIFFFWASVWAMASKFIFAPFKKHIFNPAAFAVALTALTVNLAASWWVGNIYMLPLVILGGFLLVRKTQRFGLVLSFALAAIIAVAFSALLKGGNPFSDIWTTFLYTPLFFLASVMLTEPLTTPPTRGLQIVYGALVGVLFAPAFHIGSIYTTPELALLVGNIFAYIVSPKSRLVLTLKDKKEIGPGIYDFVFHPKRKPKFRPGQYLEWTLGHEHPDSRGVRRYFTIASSPTEPEVRLGVKFYPNSSTFKNALLKMERGDEIMASQLAGDFILPRKDGSEKFVFLAGGIGITPFRSMIKYLSDKGDRRPITLFYAAGKAEEMVYKDLFDEAAARVGLRTIYVVADKNDLPEWADYGGFLNADIIEQEVPDYLDRTFYISGPRSMVTAFEDTLTNMGVERSHVKTDFFPGLA